MVHVRSISSKLCGLMRCMSTECNYDFRLPKRIILVRHGESLGNVDEGAYADTPDWSIPLTDEGKLQAQHLGGQLKELIGTGLSFIVAVYSLRLLGTP